MNTCAGKENLKSQLERLRISVADATALTEFDVCSFFGCIFCSVFLLNQVVFDWLNIVCQLSVYEIGVAKLTNK